ncbi:DUF58 domain-containing protein [Halomicrococcus sp. NG-SE-24]|uniref:DUF58 domain-containing protein n=1 Tax=Halomicrococcus sp. NG-SE-24 TaxID=3436928 RepID=UPI003D98369B
MLTRRGFALLGVAVLSVAMAVPFGARSLNAVVGPVVVALAVGFVQVKRTDHPDLTTTVPTHGFRGETATVALEFSASNPFAASVTLETDDGLVGDETVETNVGETTVEFEVELAERGERRVGPVRVVATDVFGLFRREFTHRIRETVLVFPTVREVSTPTAVSALREESAVPDDREFDQLRAYRRGDPLRDVHWKSSAKRPDEDLLVREFRSEEDRAQVEVVAEADGGRVDDVADAAASVAVGFVDAGFAVGLSSPDGRVDPASDEYQDTRLLTLLAHMETGSVPAEARDRADVVVHGLADGSTVEIRVGDRVTTFEEFAAGGASPDDAESRRTVRRVGESGPKTDRGTHPTAPDGGNAGRSEREPRPDEERNDGGGPR